MNPVIAGPTSLSSARIRLALLALALGGFGIGSTEFVAMGLLPNIAHDLLPQVYAQSPNAANAQAGWIISAYALGVVVGAPTIAALAARWPRKKLLLWLLVAFTVGTVASALAPTFGLVLVARFLSALPHGAYFGIASLVAAFFSGAAFGGFLVLIARAGYNHAQPYAALGVPGYKNFVRFRITHDDSGTAVVDAFTIGVVDPLGEDNAPALVDRFTFRGAPRRRSGSAS